MEAIRDPLAAQEIYNPLTAELVPDDVDDLAHAYFQLKTHVEQCRVAIATIARTLAERADSEAKTRRLRGEKVRLKIEMPDATFTQPTLKQAWNDFPWMAERYLGIGTITVQMREYAKLKNETGTEDFEKFKALVMSAYRAPTGTPKITLEETDERHQRVSDSVCESPVGDAQPCSGREESPF